MKKFACLSLLGLLTIMLVSCAKATPQPVEPKPSPIAGLINPGDMLGDFLITTGNEKDIYYVTKVHCPYDQSTSTESCEIPVGTKVNVGLGIYGDNSSNGKTLDELWSEQSHEMFIEGRPVNLQAFGTIDFDNPTVGTVRVWNVVIVTDKPGKITARSTGIVGDDPFDYIVIVTFTAP